MPLIAVSVEALVVALVAVLLIMAYYVMVSGVLVSPLRALGQAEHGVLDNIPWVGGLIGNAVGSMAGSLANGVERVTAAAASKVEGAFEGTVGPIVDFFFTAANTERQLWQSIQGFGTDLVAALDHLVTVTIPGMLDTARSEAGQLALTAKGEAEEYASQAIGALDAKINGVEQSIENEISSGATSIRNTIEQKAGTLQAEIEAIPADIANAANAVRAEAFQAIGQTIATLQGEATAIAQRAHTEAMGVEAKLEDTIGAVAGQLTDQFTAADAAQAAAAAAATAAVAATFVNFMDECGNDLCGGLGPLSKLIPDIAAWLETGALLGFVALAAKNPQAAADVADELFKPLIDVADGILSTAGVR